jgi:hypothetical protein
METYKDYLIRRKIDKIVKITLILTVFMLSGIILYLRPNKSSTVKIKTQIKGVDSLPYYKIQVLKLRQDVRILTKELVREQKVFKISK